MPELADLAGRLRHAFRDPELIARALTHPSYAHEHPPAAHNEVLGFLGDAVLGLAVAELLSARAPRDGAGSLTQRRAQLVSARNLAAWAVRLGIPPHLRLGHGEEHGGGRGKESILATAFEAVVGAVYLDGGLIAAQAVIARLIDEDVVETVGRAKPGDP